ncbi:dimethylsulfonioproprionate lyase family protein [Cribrihabitans neustonicus]|uniref:dimethylsulfonioproprionate lyase family protein n=1 Tax=Cribrihabitans neustonicus TaxID=1429085 RepID=UPI003B5CF1B7
MDSFAEPRTDAFANAGLPLPSSPPADPARLAFDRTLAAARGLHAALPAMAAFQPWPDDLTWAGRAAAHVPGAELLAYDPGQAAASGPAAAEVRALQETLAALAPYAEWRLTYTEAEVGADFLRRFGWFELAGPTGHFHSEQIRMTVGYWGRGLDYPWHQHGPEELYCVLSGHATFLAEGEAPLVLTPGDTRLHGANQPHAMVTGDEPVLCFVLWRGEGLAEDPRMSVS